MVSEPIDPWQQKRFGSDWVGEREFSVKSLVAPTTTDRPYAFFGYGGGLDRRNSRSLPRSQLAADGIGLGEGSGPQILVKSLTLDRSVKTTKSMARNEAQSMAFDLPRQTPYYYELRRQLESAELALAASGYRRVVKVPDIVPGKIPNPASISGKRTKTMSELTAVREVVKYEEVATDPTAVWRIVSTPNLRPSGEPRNLRNLVQPAKVEMETTRRSDELRRINLNSTQEIQPRGAPEGNLNPPLTGFSVVAMGWEQDQLPNVSVRRIEWENPEDTDEGDFGIPSWLFEDTDEGEFGIPSWLFGFSLPDAVERAKDLVVLKEDAPTDLLKPINVGPSSVLRVGQQCLAIGNPFGFNHPLTVGIISGLNQDIFSKAGVTIEDGAHFLMKQDAVLYNLEAHMLPKDHHCYFIRLMLEYSKFSSLDSDNSSACKFNNSKHRNTYKQANVHVLNYEAIWWEKLPKFCMQQLYSVSLLWNLPPWPDLSFCEVHWRAMGMEKGVGAVSRRNAYNMVVRQGKNQFQPTRDKQLTDFEKEWVARVEQYKLKDNEWFSALYSCRKQWAPGYVNHSFWAGTSTIRTVEKPDPYLDGAVTTKSTLLVFLEQYEATLKRELEWEAYDELHSYYSRLVLLSGLPFGEQLVELCTVPMFQAFQDEIKQLTHVFCEGDKKCGRQKLEVLDLDHNTITGVEPSYQRFTCLKSLSLRHVSALALDLSLLVAACPKMASLSFDILEIVTSDSQSPRELISHTLKRLFAKSVGVDKIILDADNLEVLHLNALNLDLFELIGKVTLKHLMIEDVSDTHLDIGESTDHLEVVDVSNFTIVWPKFYSMISRASSLRLLRFWGENFFDPTTKRWTSKNIGSATYKRGFVQFYYEPIKQIIKTCMNDQKDKLCSLLRKLGVTLKTDEKELMGKTLIKSVMRTCLLACNALLEMRIFHLSYPFRAHKYHVENLFEGSLDDIYTIAIRNCDQEGQVAEQIRSAIEQSTSDYVKEKFYGGVVVLKIGVANESSADAPESLYLESVALRNSIVLGFQFATNAGPLCDEPMWGLAFIVEPYIFADNSDVANQSDQYNIFSRQVITAVKEACRAAVLQNNPRLVEVMYFCELTTPTEQLGSIYAVLSKKRARVLKEEMQEGTPLFTMHAYLPIAESFGFSNQLRSVTSGAASALLVLSHWEVSSEDPFFTPKTQEVDSCLIRTMKFSVFPVVRVAVQCNAVSDLPKLVESLKRLAKLDIMVLCTKEGSGELSCAGIGELHLEILLEGSLEDADWRMQILSKQHSISSMP